MSSYFNVSRSYLLGVTFILLVAIIWSGGSVLVQYIFQNLDFQSPFLITYICNSLFVIYLPLWQLWIALGWIVNPPKLFRDPNLELVKTSEGLDDSDSSSHQFITSSDEIDEETSNKKRLVHIYSHEDVIRVALVISPVWFLANCLYNYSLLMTSVSSSTIIRFVLATLSTQPNHSIQQPINNIHTNIFIFRWFGGCHPRKDPRNNLMFPRSCARGPPGQRRQLRPVESRRGHRRTARRHRIRTIYDYHSPSRKYVNDSVNKLMACRSRMMRLSHFNYYSDTSDS